MGSLRERLRWDGEQGSVTDGPRRYLLMRPDVLMGALVRLDERSRAAWLEAAAESAQVQGGESLRAYAAAVGGERQALIEATVAAAADLGWGRWSLRCESDILRLQVHSSPFVAGWHAAGGGSANEPLCAPVRGLLAALAALVLAGEVRVRECRCVAQRARSVDEAEAVDTGCEFEARSTPMHGEALP